MRIVQLTPGTGNFYCGSCIRDNTLVTALRAQGHDAVLVPMYLPHLTDEESAVEAGEGRIFFGGINVYLQQKSALFRRAPRWLDRMLDAPVLLRLAAERSGMTTAHDLGELTLSMLRGEEGGQGKELAKLIEWLAQLDPRPEVISLSNVLLLGVARSLRKELGVPVICTLQGEDTFLDGLPEPYRTRCWDALAERAQEIPAFVAVSRYYRGVMLPRLKVPPEKVRVVYNGINLEGYKPAPAPPEVPTIGYLARMHAGKGLPALVEAFIAVSRRGKIPGAKLRIAGAQTSADLPLVEQLKARIDEHRLAGSVDWLPNIDRPEKLAFLQSLSVLSVPALYGESFGLYVIEALAAGVPVAQPRHAAFPELVAETGGGILYDPEHPQALREALETILGNPEQARIYGEQGREAVRAKFDHATMARAFAAVCEDILPQPAATS